MTRRNFFGRLVGVAAACFGVATTALAAPPIEFVTIKRLTPEQLVRLRRDWEALTSGHAGRWCILDSGMTYSRGFMTMNDARANNA